MILVALLPDLCESMTFNERQMFLTSNEIFLLAINVQRYPTHCRRRSCVDKFNVLIWPFKHLEEEEVGEIKGWREQCQ